MARPASTRSPSPIGSARRHASYRDRSRDHRRRSRSPQPHGARYAARRDDADHRRRRSRDRSLDRKDREHYRPNNRDDDRRRRPHSREPDRRRRDSRDSDRRSRDYKDTSRRRRDSRDSKEGGRRRGESRDGERRRLHSRDTAPERFDSNAIEHDARNAMKGERDSSATPKDSRLIHSDKLTTTTKRKVSPEAQPAMSEKEKKLQERRARMEKWKKRDTGSTATSASFDNHTAETSHQSKRQKVDSAADFFPIAKLPAETLSNLLVKKPQAPNKRQTGAVSAGFDVEPDREKKKPPKLPKLKPIADDDKHSRFTADEDETDDVVEHEDQWMQKEPEDMTADELAKVQEAAEAGRQRALAQENMRKAQDINSAAGAVAAPLTDANDDDSDMDELDAYMLDLEKSEKAAKPAFVTSKPQEMYYSDDEQPTAVALDDAGEVINIKTKKKRDIPTIDYSKITLEPIQKAFYTEPSEIAEMTDDELSALRFELDGIKVRGKDVPRPVVKWSHMGLGIQSLNAIQGLGFEAPTAIQAQAIPAIMCGRDVLGIAKTGSGKTLAFLLPMFRHIKAQRPLENMEGPVSIVLAPTRELATQIHRECKPWLKALGLRAVCAYGGAPIKDQIADFKSGAEIVVCTPGRMIDILASNNGRVTNLKRTTYVVLDEADRMFDMGFEPQVMKILKNVRPDRQIALFSATFPRNIEGLAKRMLENPIQIVVGGQGVVAPEIQQMIEVRPENSKFNRLLNVLGKVHATDEEALTLVFVDRQESAEDLMNNIMKRGYPCMTIHGGKDQYDRDSVIADFKAGVFPVMVATSVAARGLDVKQLRLVVNYDVPNHLEDYVHRSGRTGRAGQKGLAVTFVTPEQDKYAASLVKALKASQQPVPEELQKLAESFAEKVKAGKEKQSGSGFGGKGLSRFETEREKERARERQAFGEGQEDSGDTEDKDADDEEKLNDFMKKALGQNGTNDEQAETRSDDKAAQPHGVPKGISLNERDIKVSRTDRDATEQKAGGLAALKGLSELNNSLRKSGSIRGTAPVDNKGPDAGNFHATLEINDFPQKARWGVTNRTNVAKILEATGTSITTKGNFYPPGKDPGPGEAPKLYILVEGDTEIVVKDAMKELFRLLREGTQSAHESESRAAAHPTGRYSVT